METTTARVGLEAATARFWQGGTVETAGRTYVLQNHHEHPLLGSPGRDTAFHLFAGFLFVSTGLVNDAFVTPRPDTYLQASESKAPVVSQSYESKSQLDIRLK